MILMLKIIGTKLLLNWKLYSIYAIVALSLSYITYNKFTISKLKKQKNKLVIELQDKELEYSQCLNTNDENQYTIKELLEINTQITNQFDTISKQNYNSVKELKTYEDLQNKKIQSLLKQIKQDGCSNIIVDDINIKLLKKAGSNKN